jgi:hypothetical protein
LQWPGGAESLWKKVVSTVATLSIISDDGVVNSILKSGFLSFFPGLEEIRVTPRVYRNTGTFHCQDDEIWSKKKRIDCWTVGVSDLALLSLCVKNLKFDVDRKAFSMKRLIELSWGIVVGERKLTDFYFRTEPAEIVKMIGRSAVINTIQARNLGIAGWAPADFYSGMNVGLINDGPISVLRAAIGRTGPISLSESRSLMSQMTEEDWNSLIESGSKFNDYLRGKLRKRSQEDNEKVVRLCSKILGLTVLGPEMTELVNQLIWDTCDVRLQKSGLVDHSLVTVMYLSEFEVCKVVAEHLEMVMMTGDKSVLSDHLIMVRKRVLTAASAAMKIKSADLDDLLISLESVATWEDVWRVTARMAGVFGEMAHAELTGDKYHPEASKPIFSSILKIRDIRYLDNELTRNLGCAGERVTQDNLQKIVPSSIGCMTMKPDFFRKIDGKLILTEVGLVSSPLNKAMIDGGKWHYIESLSKVIDIELEVIPYERSRMKNLLESRRLPYYLEFWSGLDLLRSEAGGKSRASKISEEELDEETNMVILRRGKLTRTIPRISNENLTTEMANFQVDWGGTIPDWITNAVSVNSFSEPPTKLSVEQLTEICARLSIQEIGNNHKKTPAGIVYDGPDRLKNTESAFFKKLGEMDLEFKTRDFATKTLLEQMRLAGGAINEEGVSCGCEMISVRLSSLLNSIVRQNAFTSEARMSISHALRHKLSRVLLAFSCHQTNEDAGKDYLYLNHQGQVKKIPTLNMLFPNGIAPQKVKEEWENGSEKKMKSMKDFFTRESRSMTGNQVVKKIKGLMSLLDLEPADFELDPKAINLDNIDMHKMVEKITGRKPEKLAEKLREKRSTRLAKIIEEIEGESAEGIREVSKEEGRLKMLMSDVEDSMKHENLSEDNESQSTLMKFHECLKRVVGKIPLEKLSASLIRLSNIKTKLLIYSEGDPKREKYENILNDILGEFDHLKDAIGKIPMEAIPVSIRRAWLTSRPRFQKSRAKS